MYSETVCVLVVNLLLQTRLSLVREKSFGVRFWEIDDIVSILLHNPYCQPDVRQLSDDISAAKSPEGDIVSIIIEESRQFPSSTPLKRRHEAHAA